MQLHTLTSVHMIKVPDIGSCTIVWTHDNTTHPGSTPQVECGCPAGTVPVAVISVGVNLGGMEPGRYGLVVLKVSVCCMNAWCAGYPFIRSDQQLWCALAV